MTFLKKLLGRQGDQAASRVRICLQCGMPIGEHKDWCSIHKARQSNQGLPPEAVATD